MNTRELAEALGALFRELVEGAPDNPFMLNSGDAGLLRSLDKLSAAAASKSSEGGASIAAHVDHLRYGLSLMNRWATEGGNPFATADWAAAWRTSQVTDQEWAQLRSALRAETERWTAVLNAPREVNEIELRGMIGSVAHLGYHLGAIRQIDRAARGPAESAIRS